MKTRAELRLGYMAELSKYFLEQNEIAEVMKAYDHMDSIFGNLLRDSGDFYATHTSEASLIPIKECGIINLDLTITILEHDTPEFKNGTFASGTSMVYISNNFGVQNAFRIGLLTKSKLEFFRQNHYPILIFWGDVVSLVAKLADILHNCRTLEKTDEGKQRRKAETVRDEVPEILDALRTKIPREFQNRQERNKYLRATDILEVEIQKAIAPYNRLLIAGP
jgi:(p)ppGpp synthase/HD superfamily hydrolase